MPARVGLDVGSVSVKLAAILGPEETQAFRKPLAETAAFHLVSEPKNKSSTSGLGSIVVSECRRSLGNPSQAALDLLREFQELLPDSWQFVLSVTGSGGHHVAEALNLPSENEFKAIARGVSALYPQIRTVLEMGGENSKYILLGGSRNREGGDCTDPGNSSAGILDYSMSSQCAAGTGSFIDQQASRLQYRVEDIGAVVLKANSTARIAGRCSVFAKSDMIHAQQKGYSTAEVLKGLCEAVSRNFKSNIVKGRKVIAPIAFIGGVSQNSGVVRGLADAFHLAPEDIIVPELYAWLGAIGAALLAAPAQGRPLRIEANYSAQKHSSASISHCEPLSLQNVLLLRDHPAVSRTEPMPETGSEAIPTYLGIDIGSVSTNLALLDESGRLLHGIYLRTAGRPIEVVNQGLQEIEKLFGTRVRICGVGTTGSGRELIGELVGADTVNDEITAHKTGAMYVHDRIVRHLDGQEKNTASVDTIFEIGGQDAKYISIDRGVVVDFAMNEACAAGTGSFLEEQAERLGVQIKDEFARLALSSRAPARLGERCTVFMERDVNAAMQQGAGIPDLAAGLAYSVALNYLNRVVRGRKIGDVIYFQGGTAYNDAVAAAFSQILGKRIIVPPHNGIIGAIGMALIAQEVAGEKGRIGAAQEAGSTAGIISISLPVSTFRGFDLNQTHFETREFVCRACSNYCDMKEITVAGEKTYWGDKCSDKFRKRIRTGRRPVIEDLLAFRDRALFANTRDSLAFPESGPGPLRQRVGIPRAMFFFDRFPFWRTYLQEIGFDVLVSPAGDSHIAAQGAEISVAEPCFPVQIAHGHVKTLLSGTPECPPVDFVLLPNVMDMEAPRSSIASQLCPWNQTLPFVVRSAPAFEEQAGKILCPTIYFRLGHGHVKSQLHNYFSRFGVTRRASDIAVDLAFAAQARFSDQLLTAGREAFAVLEKTGEPAILLVGRPYNIYDRSSNCDVPRKLRDLYGVNVLPLDFLPLDEAGIDDLHPNMFWNSGRRILAAGRFARNHPNLHIIYISNFKCGPDSFIKHFLRDVALSPFLILQFDGHGNDAGYLTRCEAYLDSKGILRCSSNGTVQVA
ncbi:MAG: acyl-CoA dehydratase activase [Acidobacteriia bacterium]|nr:acyl-CoA dehydratase activase [Terriglobia bacterium]